MSSLSRYSPTTRASRRSRRARKGVVLLLVVTLLVMFLLIGVTGVIVATAFHTSARASSGASRREIRYEDFSDRVMMQVLRGADPRSAIWGHDLLADLYGVDNYFGTIQVAAADAQLDRQFLVLTVTITNRFDLNSPNDQVFYEPDFFVGRLFSIFAPDGSLVEPTVRVVRSDIDADDTNFAHMSNLHTGGYPPNQIQYKVVIDNERGLHGIDAAGAFDPTILVGKRFMISGAPFNGSGAGYKTANTYRADGTQIPMDPVANFTPNARIPIDVDQDGDYVGTPDLQVHTLLLPNFSRYALGHANAQMIRDLAPYLNGADEPWDAPDLNNMWLSRTDQVSGLVIPSYYRAQHVAFLRDVVFANPMFDLAAIDNDTMNSFLDTEIPNLSPEQKNALRVILSRAILRPLTIAHPGFSAGNPAFAFDLSDTSTDTRTVRTILNNMASPAAICDVDTDGDQVKDAIWIDPGLPVQQAADGRRFKILAAIRVEDLNARINLNTASNEAYAYMPYQQMQSPPFGTTSFFAGGANNLFAPRGSGFGGSEVGIPLPNQDLRYLANLQELLGIPVNPNNLTPANLITPQSPLVNVTGRYGVDTVPGGSGGADILLTMRASQFVTPEQVFGLRHIGLDHDGQPLFMGTANAFAPRAAVVSPYRMSPLWNFELNDYPFRNTETESLVRAYDVDAQILDERLQAYAKRFTEGDPANGIPGDPLWAKNVTNLSTHVPTAGQLPQKELRAVVESYSRAGIAAATTHAGFSGFISTAFDQLYCVDLMTNAVNPLQFKANPVETTLTAIELKHLALVLADEGGMMPGTQQQIAKARLRARADFKSMLPFELRHGYAMNVNRAFGNGVDDATNWAGVGPNPGSPWVIGADGRIDNNILIQRAPMSGTYDVVAEDYRPALPNPNPGNGASSQTTPEGQDAFGGAVTFAGYQANSHFLNDIPDLVARANHIRPPTGYLQRFPTDPRQIYARHMYLLAYLSLRTNPTTGNKFLFGLDSATMQPSQFSAVQQRELLMRRLAQWAVNVADYRDPDSVMTCFEFDMYPENGWDCDGDPRTIEPVPTGSPFAGDPQGERRVVWGCERPEVLLTESLAFHDRCVADTAQGGNRTVTGDQDLDQVKFPQASLFLELYCPRPRSLGGATVASGDYPTDMYTSVPALGVDLSRMAPAAPDGTRQRPVWRIAISESTALTRGGAGPVINGKDPLKVAPEDYFDSSITPMDEQNRHLVTYQPEAMLGIRNGETSPSAIEPANLEIEREIWFAPVDLNSASNPAANTTYGLPDENRKRKIFYNRTPAVTTIQPGRYLAVGPRMTTQIGQGSAQQITFAPPAPPAPQVSVQVYTSDQTIHPYAWGGPNASFTPSPGWSNTHPSTGKQPMYNGDNVAEQNVQAPNVMICASLLPANAAWTGSPPGVMELGIAGGLKGVGLNISTPVASSADPYWAVSHVPNQAGDTYTVAPNVPFDNDAASVLSVDGIVQADPTNTPKSTGTYEKYKVAFLQRLADPSLPYNPMPPPVGSTVTPDPDHTHRPELPVNPYITVDSISLDLTVFNGSEAPHQPITAMSMTQQWDSADEYTETSYSPNTAAHDAWRISTQPQIKFATREKGGLDPVSGTAVLWTPGTTAPALTIDKVPMGTTYGQELDPNSHFDFNLKHSLGYLNESLGGLSRQAAHGGNEQVYNGSPAAPFHWLAWANGPFSSAHEVMLVPASSPNRLLHEMGDIVNVPAAQRTDFYNPQMTPDPVTNGAQFTYLMNFFRSEATGSTGAAAPDMSRMLELLSTPNQFVGTDRWYRPASMPAPNSVNAAGTEWTNDFRPPFNNFPQMREAGRINLNTTQQYVWQNAIAANYPEHYMRGLQVGATFTSNPPSVSPELFNNPLRPSDSSQMLPNYSLLGGPDLSSGYTSAQAGLLRGQNPSVPVPADPTGPVFAALDTSVPAISAANPGFRYQGISRLANTTTNQANAFGVWITIGRFEATYNPGNPLNSDGYQLGAELGYEDGTQRRQRSFFIVDRTVPVTYESGKNHNTSRCILLRRVLE